MTFASANQPRRLRGHRGYWAFLLHRISGLALALFLPAHFLVLGLAIEGEAALDGFLVWSQLPLVKLAEAVLAALLVLHMVGGIRLLVLEFKGWRDSQRIWIMIAFKLAVLVGAVFLLRASL